ncbi:hypothetical protein, partial [Streptococcus loxodontisalivarius]
AKNLALKTSHTQKPHSDSFVLIVFETEIIVWFYVEARFCPASIIYRNFFACFLENVSSHRLEILD